MYEEPGEKGTFYIVKRATHRVVPLVGTTGVLAYTTGNSVRLNDQG